MSPKLESIERDIFGCHFVSVLYPTGAYTYKLTSARDVDRVRYYADKGLSLIHI